MGEQTTSTLEDLLVRVEGATGPDRELDARIWCFDKGYTFLRISTDDDYRPPYLDCEPGPEYRERGMPKVGAGHLLYYDPTPGTQPGGGSWPHHNSMSSWTAYTGSFEAAKALAASELPGHAWELCWGGTRARPTVKHAEFDPDMRRIWRVHEGATDALALLAALLKALISLPGERSEPQSEGASQSQPSGEASADADVFAGLDAEPSAS